jgi:hypothetical protein
MFPKETNLWELLAFHNSKFPLNENLGARRRTVRIKGAPFQKFNKEKFRFSMESQPSNENLGPDLTLHISTKEI